MKRIKSVTLSSKKEFERVHASLVDLYNKNGVHLDKLLNSSNLEQYCYVKSHRSNVTEGNTTSVGEFTDLVRAKLNDEDDYIVPNKAHDETLEITNLKKVYDFLKNKRKYDSNLILMAHSILGKNIFRNNLVETRGKFKTQTNYVPFIFEGVEYGKVFIEPSEVKLKTKDLFECWNTLGDSNEASVFSKFLILQLELISIHPFNDGNGRIARAVSESYLESKEFTPYTPYSTSHKKVYQEAMAEYSIISLNSKIDAYNFFGNFILNAYEENVNDLNNSIEKICKVTRCDI